MNFKPCISIKSLIVIILPRLMLFLVSECIMLRMICLKKLLSILNVLSRFNQKKSSGLSWLHHATAEWIFSTKLWKSTKKFMIYHQITLIVWEVWYRSEKNLVWNTSNSLKNLWFWTEKKKLDVSLNISRTLKLTSRCSNSRCKTNNSSTCNKRPICLICVESAQ